MTTLWLATCAVLLIGGLLPAVVVACFGDAVHRLVGLELVSVIAVLAMLAFSQASDQPSYLVVPLVLAVLGVTGTLVYTRLLGPRP